MRNIKKLFKTKNLIKIALVIIALGGFYLIGKYVVCNGEVQTQSAEP